MLPEKVVTACVLVIGNEILSGRTQDKNLQFLALNLNEIGIRVTEARVIPDVRETIVATVDWARRHFDYVFTTGGIGPTHDDITSECVGEAFGRPMRRFPEAVAALEARLKPGELNEARLRMATFPDGAELVKNRISAAPGFRMENVYVLAGIPSIMQAMFEELKSGLRGGRPVQSRTVVVALGEGAIAAGLGALQESYADIDIGSYPAVSGPDRRFRVSVVMRGTDPVRLDACRDELLALLRGLGGTPEEIVGKTDGEPG
ncbi:MAG: competence/damage-inducible protein A [Alphaproteobacteria bacterium]|nr:competence/damage-inducible protein A [Alphaproteobacteria bacterium]